MSYETTGSSIIDSMVEFAQENDLNLAHVLVNYHVASIQYLMQYDPDAATNLANLTHKYLSNEISPQEYTPLLYRAGDELSSAYEAVTGIKPTH